MVWMKVPYTNFHNLNQDWIIHRMMEFEEYMQNIVQISVIKYADPIQWRITGQYEQATVVIDAETGVAYISVQPVPAGIAITNTSYWTPVFDLRQILGNINERINDEETARIATDTTLQDNIDALEQQILDAGTKHYYQEGELREWVNVSNQAEFEAFLKGFNQGYTSKSCYINSPGTYKFIGGETSGVYPVINGIQAHIYVTANDVTIDLNCATVYTSHLVIQGNNVRPKIIDTNTYDTSRSFYPEGGTTFFTNCDFYTSITVWSGAICIENCTWYDYKPGRGMCLDLLGGAICRSRNNMTFNIRTFHNADDGLIGCGDASVFTHMGRMTIYRPTERSGYLFKMRRGGMTTIMWTGSAYDPDNSRSYAVNNVGNLNAAFGPGTDSAFQIYYSNEQFFYTGAVNTQTRIAAIPYGTFPPTEG